MVYYLYTASKLAIVIRVSWMTVMWQMLSVSKEAFSLLSTSKMPAVGMDIKVYRHSQALNGELLSGEIVIKLVLEQVNIFLFS